MRIGKKALEVWGKKGQYETVVKERENVLRNTLRNRVRNDCWAPFRAHWVLWSWISIQWSCVFSSVMVNSKGAGRELGENWIMVLPKEQMSKRGWVVSACKRLFIMMDHLFKFICVNGVRREERTSMDWRSCGSQKIVGVGYWKAGVGKVRVMIREWNTWHSIPLHGCTEFV